MQQLETLDDILTFNGRKDSKHIYLDKTFNIEGIDYNNFIQMKFEDINESNIKKLYTINGWYILFYLMSNAYQAQYITTSISIIGKETGIKLNTIKTALKHLNSINIIKTHVKTFTVETVLHIAIGYNNSKTSLSNKNGFKAIPTEYIKSIITNISPNEWAILSVLFVKYSYYSPTKNIDRETGEIIYDCTINHYAFPTQEQICEYIGVTEKTLRLYSKKLEDNKYKIISVYKSRSNKKTNLINENCRYRISLMERIEYIYHRIVNIDYKRDEKLTNQVNKYGFDYIVKSESQNILNNQDYILEKYGEQIKEYKKIIENEDKELYKSISKSIDKN